MRPASAGQLRQERRVILPVHHERIPPRPHSALHIRHRADRRPELTQLIHAHVMPQPLPHMSGGHPLAHHIGKIRRHVKKSPRPHARSCTSVMYPTEDPMLVPKIPTRIPPLLQPSQASPRVLHRLAVRLQRQPDIRPHQLIRALVPLGHAPVVIRQAQLQRELIPMRCNHWHSATCPCHFAFQFDSTNTAGPCFRAVAMDLIRQPDSRAQNRLGPCY